MRKKIIYGVLPAFGSAALIFIFLSQEGGEYGQLYFEKKRFSLTNIYQFASIKA